MAAAAEEQVFVCGIYDAVGKLVLPRASRVPRNLAVVATELLPTHAVALQELVHAVANLRPGTCNARIGNDAVVARLVRATALLQLLQAPLLPMVPAYSTSQRVLLVLTAVATALENHAGVVGGSFADSCRLLCHNIMEYTATAKSDIANWQHLKNPKSAKWKQLKNQVDGLLLEVTSLLNSVSSLSQDIDLP